MAVKAIAITSFNIQGLKSRFEIEDVTEPLEIGYWLVKDFDQLDQPYDILTTTVLKQNYYIIGKLENGFIELERKEYTNG